MSIHQAMCSGQPHPPTIHTAGVIQAYGVGLRVQVCMDGKHWADVRYPNFDPRFSWRVHPDDKVKAQPEALIQIGPLDV